MSERRTDHTLGRTDLLTAMLDRATLSRRLTFLMLVRVIVFTLLLGGTVVTYLFIGTLEQLGGPYITFLFIFIAALYLLNIVYAVLMRFMSNLGALAAIQLGVDMVIAAILVNFTGGADSAFMMLFMLSPIGAALTLNRRAAMITASVATTMLIVVITMGYTRLLPTLPGQMRLPWEVSRDSIVSAVLINGSAMLAVALLSGYLSEQIRSAQLTLKRQKAAIYDLTTHNEDIIRCLTSGLITINLAGEVLAINRHAQEILNVDDPHLAGRALEDLSPELARAASGDESTSRAEIELDLKGARKRIGISVSPLIDHQNKLHGQIINFQDLTSWHRMELLVKQSEHLASLGRITAGIAHEIRNPLGAISASLEMVRAGSDLPEEDGRLMTIALREIDRLDNLIRDLLVFARPREWDPRRLDLGKELDDLAEAISQLTSGLEGLSLVAEVQDETRSYWIKADTEKLKSVLWNLVINAWEAGERERILLRLYQNASGRVVLDVCDEGEGIPKEKQKHIFEPFFTTKDTGTGLGLATVYQIIQEHEANIEVQSTEGEGTTFRISFPDQSTTEEHSNVPAPRG